MRLLEIYVQIIKWIQGICKRVKEFHKVINNTYIAVGLLFRVILAKITVTNGLYLGNFFFSFLLNSYKMTLFIIYKPNFGIIFSLECSR